MIHECSICHKKEEWHDGWSWWGSLLMEDDGLPILKVCSEQCRAAVDLLGGAEAVLGAIWDAKGSVVLRNRRHYKDILRWRVKHLVLA